MCVRDTGKELNIFCDVCFRKFAVKLSDCMSEMKFVGVHCGFVSTTRVL